MNQKRNLVSIKDREFSLELAPFTGEPRYIHKLESGADGNNVKRQFDDILFAQGLAKGNVKLLPPDNPNKILLTTEAYQVWQKFKEQEPGRKKRTLPEHRQFYFDGNHRWVHTLANNEMARIVAGTLTSNAKEIYGVELEISYDKNNNSVCMDNHSLANYLNAIIDKKPALLENPEYKQYVYATLQSINAATKQLSQTTFKKHTNYSNAQTISSFGMLAQKRGTDSHNKSVQEQHENNEQALVELVSPAA